ncbi:hypothetical protein STAN_4402 [Streptomyces sp. CBMAI 2042]|nr:hypothetical protein STAN_4402 [Streptomyces sp. CBMAI 2042]
MDGLVEFHDAVADVPQRVGDMQAQGCGRVAGSGEAVRLFDGERLTALLADTGVAGGQVGGGGLGPVGRAAAGAGGQLDQELRKLTDQQVEPEGGVVGRCGRGGWHQRSPRCWAVRAARVVTGRPLRQSRPALTPSNQLSAGATVSSHRRRTGQRAQARSAGAASLSLRAKTICGGIPEQAAAERHHEESGPSASSGCGVNEVMTAPWHVASEHAT